MAALIGASLCLLSIVQACSVSYSFNGSNINYEKVKSISFDKFPIRSAYVWAPMEGMFYNSLSDAYAQKTKLKVLKRNGDLQLAGEIGGGRTCVENNRYGAIYLFLLLERDI